MAVKLNLVLVRTMQGFAKTVTNTIVSKLLAIIFFFITEVLLSVMEIVSLKAF